MMGAQMDKTPTYLTENEAADLVRRDPKTLTRWRRTRVPGPVYVRVMGRVLYPRQRLVEWLESQIVEASQ